jgi:hypothetical protein
MGGVFASHEFAKRRAGVISMDHVDTVNAFPSPQRRVQHNRA